jgi:hypothetical protein
LALLGLACSGDKSAGNDTAEGALEQACRATDRTLYFHGTSGYGRELARPGVCAPRVEEFWSDDLARIDARATDVLAGYSAGRIPVLRRLDAGVAIEKTVVLLDPSWVDGRRFAGKTGPEIVEAWLNADRARRFVLVYSPSSVGHREYASLATLEHIGTQVMVCKLDGQHLDLPRLAGPELLLSIDQWLATRCRQ